VIKISGLVMGIISSRKPGFDSPLHNIVQSLFYGGVSFVDAIVGYGFGEKVSTDK